MHVANLGNLRLRFHKFHMHLLHMIVQIPWKLECFSASKTRKYLHFDMSVHVRLTISARCKLLLTQVTLEWLFTIVDSATEKKDLVHSGHVTYFSPECLFS